MEQTKEGSIYPHFLVLLLYQNGAGREVPRCDSPVPQSAKTGANEYLPQTALAHVNHNAAELTGNNANRTPAPSSGAGVRNAPPTLDTDGQVGG
jgi:hypothetical protein